jgi:hypothetical protein
MDSSISRWIVQSTRIGFHHGGQAPAVIENAAMKVRCGRSFHVMRTVWAAKRSGPNVGVPLTADSVPTLTDRVAVPVLLSP